jgi:hypothetical protein
MQRLSSTSNIQYTTPLHKQRVLRNTWTKSRSRQTSVSSIRSEISNLLVSGASYNTESLSQYPSVDGIDLISAIISRRTSTVSISKPPSGHSRRPSLQSYTPLSSNQSLHTTQDTSFISSQKVIMSLRPGSARHNRENSNTSETGRSAIPGSSPINSRPSTAISGSSSLIGIKASKGVFGQHYAQGLIPCRVAHGTSIREGLMWEVDIGI